MRTLFTDLQLSQKTLTGPQGSAAGHETSIQEQERAIVEQNTGEERNSGSVLEGGCSKRSEHMVFTDEAENIRQALIQKQGHA